MMHYSQAGLPPSPTMKKDNPRVTTNSDSLSLIAGLQSGTCLIFKDRVFFWGPMTRISNHISAFLLSSIKQLFLLP